MIERLISELRQQGVRIRSEGDRILCDAPPGVMTPEIGEQLRKHKDQILKILREETSADAAGQDLVIPKISREIEIPLSFEQESLWFLDQLNPGAATYNIPVRLRIKSDVDVNILRRSLNEIVRRHEILRTCFRTIDGRPIQVIAEPIELSLPLVDLTGLPAGTRDQEADRLCQEEAERPFVLDRDLMLRPVLFKLEKENYILLLSLHHIASDASSVQILLSELVALYGAFSNGQSSPLKELTVQYADFAMWQRKRLSGEVFEQQLKYWKRQLTAAPPILDFPTETSRPAIQSFRGSIETAEVPESLANALRSLSKREGVSLFVTMFAAFQVLLYRYSGQQDIIVGSPITKRTRSGLEGLIGLFINTLPLRLDLSGNPSFRELVARAREVALGAYENQDLPFELLVKELHPERNLSYSPLFQVLFSLQNVQPRPVNLNDQMDFVSSATSKFDLSLYIRELSDGMVAEVEYCTDLFGSQSVRRVLDHFMVLLKGIVDNPDEHIDTLPLLTAPERQYLLVQCNQTKIKYGDGNYVDELFAERVYAAPDRVAVRFGDELLTYRQLDDRAEQIARHLLQQGVGPGDLVGVYVERSLDMPVALLGILKSGAAYLPLDPLYPLDRLAFMLEDAQPAAVITQKRLGGSLPHAKMRLIFLDDLPQSPSDQIPAASPARERRPEDLAYVIYTSGSTGKPKGVQVAHRSIVNFLYAMREKPGLNENDAVLAVTTLSFDIAALEIFLPLTVGATLVIASSQATSDAEQLVSLLERHEITMMQGTPATWTLLLQANWAGGPHLKILCGGETWSPRLAAQLLQRCGSLWNMYGPTETTVWSSVNRIKRNDPIRIGPPIANTSFYVLHNGLQLAPLLVPGELHIGGDCVARGYLNRPELNDEKFIPDPFSKGEADRLYKTGDLVRYLPNGSLEFLGRVDNQVKIRGFRIELDEVAAVLRQHSAVKDAVAVLQDHNALDQQLIAFIVVSEKQTANEKELKEFVKRKLPLYMVPSAFEFVETFPITPAGKIDRKALQKAPAQRQVGAKVNVPARTSTELIIADIWEGILGTEDIGARDNFFDLGGHSLMIVRTIHQINRRCNVRLGVPDLFNNPTVEQLAAFIEKQQFEGRRQPAVVQLQEGGSDIPLYFIYAGPDEFHLARLMGTRRPVFGIQVPWPLKWRQAVERNQQSLFPNMDEFVAPFVSALSAHVGSSRCMLAGHSFAGLVAFEAARQLQLRGARVDTVIVVDKWARYPSLLQTAWQNLRQCWSEKSDPKRGFGKSIADRLRRSALISWWPPRCIGSMILAALRQDSGQLTTTFDEDGVPLPWGLLERLYWKIEMEYRPQPLDCRGIIVRTDFMDVNHSVRVLDENLGWKPFFTRGTVTFSLSGDHISIFRVHNQSLALMMNKVLEQRDNG